MRNALKTDLIRLPAWEELNRQLAGLQRNFIFSSEQCIAFYSRLRRLLEASQLSFNFSKLNLICNLVLHDTLSHKDKLLPLRYFAQFLNANRVRTFEQDDFRNTINLISSLDQGISFLMDLSLPANVFEHDEFYRNFYLVTLEVLNGRRIHCYDRPYCVNNKFDEIRLSRDGFATRVGYIVSYEIRKIMGVNGQSFYIFEYECLKGEDKLSRQIQGLLEVGRCNSCGRHRYIEPEPDLFVCDACGAKHYYPG